jgi:hypothetical protein
MPDDYIVLDSNIFIVFILGLIAPDLIGKNSRTSLYDKSDYWKILELIGKKKIITCPNIWTEADNLLNFSGDNKYKYKIVLEEIMSNSIENYLESKTSLNEVSFFDLGIADTIILKLASKAKLLVSADTKLCDYAKSLSIRIFDYKDYINNKKFR